MNTPINPQDTETYQEIISQTSAWRQAVEVVASHAHALSELWAIEPFTNVVFTGCGSTYYLALAASALFQELNGVTARGAPAGELVLYPATYLNVRTLLVAVSRSGETTETLCAVEAFKRRASGAVVTISNCGDCALSALGAVNLAIPAGQEKSVAQTRSFASMYLATAALAAQWAKRSDLADALERAPAIGDALIARYETRAQEIGRNLDFDRFYFLGSGARYGLACELSLKMKEMTLTHSEPFHFLEFRHGPQSMAGPSTVVVGLLSDTQREAEARVLAEMRKLDATTLAVGESDADIVFASGLPEACRNVLYLPAIQLLALYRSLAKGLNPDRPHNLGAVVRLDRV